MSEECRKTCDICMDEVGNPWPCAKERAKRRATQQARAAAPGNVKKWQERHAESIGAKPPMYYADAEIADLRAQLARVEADRAAAVKEAWERMTKQHRLEEQLASVQNELQNTKACLHARNSSVAALKSQLASVQGMADCMDMVRQELIEAGVIDASVAPMFVANVVVTQLASVQKDAEIETLRSIACQSIGPDWTHEQAFTYCKEAAKMAISARAQLTKHEGE
jgi:DNA repair exonuclease SbcCD ATPase subunit